MTWTASYSNLYGITCDNNITGYISLFPPISLSGLQQIIISHNRITSWLNNLSTLTNLTIIELEHNLLTEELTYNLINTLRLTDIFLYSNFIHGSLPDFSNKSLIESYNL